MSGTRNSAVIFKSRPSGFPVPGKDIVFDNQGTIDIDALLLNGGVLCKTLCVGLDPFLRNRMASYIPEKPLLGYGVGVVLKSDNTAVPEGSFVHSGDYPFEEYAMLPKGTKLRLLKDEGLPWSTYLSVLGMPGQTAWVGYKACADAQDGDTIYVSGAAGLVGSVVCQLAKKDGLRVIGSAGSEDKVNYLRNEVGVDVAFNYKTDDLASVLQKHGPIDVYWDNVGGPTLELVLEHMNDFGRIVICGWMSQYNSESVYGIKNTHLICTKCLKVNGFNINKLMDRIGDFDFYPAVTALLKEGDLKVKDQISGNLSDAPQLFLNVQQGRNQGKVVINVASV